MPIPNELHDPSDRFKACKLCGRVFNTRTGILVPITVSVVTDAKPGEKEICYPCWLEHAGEKGWEA